MRKEPLIFNTINSKKPLIGEILGLNLIEPFGMVTYVIQNNYYAYYTTEEFWKVKKSKEMKFMQYYLYLNFDEINYRSSCGYTDIEFVITMSQFIEAMPKEERAQFYLNLPELTALLRL